MLPGKRIEITSPELPEDSEVELIIMLPEPAGEPARTFPDVIAFLDSLTPIQRTSQEWAEVEREFRQERDSWDF
ncbi:MAG TPA: hypothetical protein VFB38_14445 [Chthonomonadaceae bacterium]|nr:hypothetical protein [Chthonomonadaceae bacterium]